MESRDLTEYGGPGEERQKVVRLGTGTVADPNPPELTGWGDGEPRGTEKVVRVIDRMMAEEPEIECPKCRFKTRSKTVARSHRLQDSQGRIACERERQNFQETGVCGSCDGTGKAAGGDCGACGGIGRVRSKSLSGGGIDQASLEAAITGAIARGFDQFVKALQGAPPPTTGMPPVASGPPAFKQSHKKGHYVRTTSGVRGQSPAARPEPPPPVERPAVPLGDP